MRNREKKVLSLQNPFRVADLEFPTSQSEVFNQTVLPTRKSEISGLPTPRSGRQTQHKSTVTVGTYLTTVKTRKLNCSFCWHHSSQEEFLLLYQRARPFPFSHVDSQDIVCCCRLQTHRFLSCLGLWGKVATVGLSFTLSARGSWIIVSGRK